MDLEKKLKEVEIEYQQKLNNLNQTAQMFEKLKTECINLEGQIKILKEINEDPNK
jgi:hypothetical protein